MRRNSGTKGPNVQGYINQAWNNNSNNKKSSSTKDIVMTPE